MSAAAIRALIWKEWREQRLAIMLMLSSIIVWFAVVPLIYRRCGQMEAMTTNSLVILPLIIAAILGTLSFTEERVQGRWMFLSSRALDAGRVFGIKYLFGLSSSFFLSLSGLIVVALLISGRLIVIDKAYFDAAWIAGYLASVALVYSAALTGMMLTGRAVIALLLSPLIIAVAALLTIPAFIGIIPLMPSDKSLLCTYTFLLAALITVAAAALWQRDITHGATAGKTLLTLAVLILAGSILLHTASTAYTWLRLCNIQAQVRAKGLKLSIEEIIPPPVPEADNAAVLYKEAWALQKKLYSRYRKVEEKLDWWFIDKTNPGLLKDMLLEDSDAQRTFKLLEQATDMKRCRFDVDRKTGFRRANEGYTNDRMLARFLGGRTGVLLKEGRNNEALRNIEVGLKLGPSLQDGYPTLISELAKASLDSCIIPHDSKGHQLSGLIIDSRCYRRLSAAIAGRRNVLINGLKNEVAIGNEGFFGQRYGSAYNSGNKISCRSGEVIAALIYIIRTPYYGNWLGTESYGKTLLYTLHTYPFRLVLYNDNRCFLQWGMRCLDALEDSSRKPNQATVDQSEDDRNRNKLTHPVTNFVPSPETLYAEYVKCKEIPDGLRIALALKLYKHTYGSYPAALNILAHDRLSRLPADRLTGTVFHYRRQDQGFVLYSLGFDGKDDGGTVRSDIVWRSAD